MKNIRVWKEHRRRKYRQETYFQISAIYLTFNQSHTEFWVLHTHPPGSTLRQFYVRNNFLTTQNKSKMNDYTLWEKSKKTKRTSSHFLFFKSVSQTTVQVLLNKMYFLSSISFSTTARVKEISKLLLSLSLRSNMEPLCTQNINPR